MLGQVGEMTYQSLWVEATASGVSTVRGVVVTIHVFPSSPGPISEQLVTVTKGASSCSPDLEVRR